MKKLLLFLPILLFALACSEIPPIVNPVTDDGTPFEPIDISDQPRQILIEEFTGIRCVQCPAGAVEIEALRAIHGNQLVAIAIHAGGFAPPLPGVSNFDFRTPEGDQLLAYIEEPFGYPSASINRKHFEGEFNLQLGRAKWAGYIADEKAIPPKVRIGIAPLYNNDSRALEVKVLLQVDETIEQDDVRLSVSLIEDGIIDVQDTPNGKVYDYVHKHVLRTMLTNYDGNTLDGPLAAGTEIEKEFSFTIPAGWDPANMHVVAYVNLGADKEVLQVHEVKLF